MTTPFGPLCYIFKKVKMLQNNLAMPENAPVGFLSPEESEVVNGLLVDIIQFKPYLTHAERLLVWKVCKQTRRTTEYEANIVFMVAGRIKRIQ